MSSTTRASRNTESNRIFTVNIPRSSRVGPSSLEGGYAERGGNKPADFREIFVAAMLVGLHIPRSLWAAKPGTCGWYLKFWNRVVVYGRTSLLLFYFCCHDYFWPSVVMQISFGTQIVLGYVPVWFFVIERNKIKRSLGKLSLISSAPDCGESEGKSYVRIKLFLIAAVLLVFAWSASVFFYFGAWTIQYERLKPFLSFAEDEELLYYFNWMVIFSYIVSYFSGTATLYVLALLCAHTYRSCGRLFARYGRQLEREVREGPLTVAAISRRQSEFKEISSCVKDVDKALNFSAFLLYATVMNDMFNALSAAYSMDRKSHVSTDYHLFLAVKALTASTMFFYLTYSGSSVAGEKLALQKRMIRISGLFMKHSPRTQLALTYESFSSTVSHTDARVTILDLFDIKKKLILSAAGFYLTYGVYMYQFVTSSNAASTPVE